MEIYVVIETIEKSEDIISHIVFSSENKTACENYIKQMEQISHEGEYCIPYWSYYYFLDKIEL